MSRPFDRCCVRACMLVLLCTVASGAGAQTRAWLDRDRIALDETTTLNIQTDQATVSSPDYSPLLGDFTVSNNSSSRQLEFVNGVSSVRVLFAVALQPRRTGIVSIPALRVGNQRTQALALTVTPQVAAPARSGGTVFIESEADAQEPYVQQAVGYTVRLYYATPLISGQLDQDPPEGAAMQRVGEDAQYARQIGGQQYTIVERHYLLIPEHSGTLTIPGARFQGKAAGGFFDDFMGDGERVLHARSAPRFLKVQAAPADAPQPWLPLRSLTLRYLGTPQQARVGEAATISIQATADGATAAQMPELQLDQGSMASRAQIFADAPQNDETFAAGRPQATVTRRFSIVPSQAGAMRVAGPKMTWWDVRAGVARTASLPDLTLQVAPGLSVSAAAPVPGNSAMTTRSMEDSIRVPGIQGRVRPWALATVIFALLWLVTLLWGRHRREQAEAVEAREQIAPSAPASASMADLKRALQSGGLGDIADVLCALCVPAAVDLDAMRRRLDDAQQIAAVESLQRARWRDGDAVAARAALRAAFKGGPRWRSTARTANSDVLPPLYPREHAQEHPQDQRKPGSRVSP